MSAIVRRLATEGHRVSQRTLFRRLGGDVIRPAPSPRITPAPGERITPAPGEPPEVAAVRAALLDDDDLGRLTRVRDELSATLADWAPRLGSEGGAVRAYASLSRLLGDVVARLVELRPRPEAERERLDALGTEARDRLLARAREAAGRDESAELRARVVAQADLLRRLSGDAP